MFFVHSIDRRNLCLMFLTALVLSTPIMAGERAKIDLSIQVDMAPETFTPGGHNIFSVTLHNAGPSNAGESSQNELPVYVYGSSIIFPSTQPPPLEILEVIQGGCWLDRWSEPLPGGNWVVQFSYSFPPLVAGESHTCASDIAFATLATMDIATNWRVNSPLDDDINVANDRVDFTFVAASPKLPAAVASGSAWSWLTLAFLLVGAALRHVTSVNFSGHVEYGEPSRLARLAAMVGLTSFHAG